MTVMALAPEQRYDGDPVLIWRVKELERAGFNELQAANLALGRCDLHEAIELLRRGCDPAIAFDLMSD